MKPRVAVGAWPLLDIVRGVSAFLVLLGHARYLYFGTPVGVSKSPLWQQFFYGVTGLHHEAVVMFFVISGFGALSSIAAYRRRERYAGVARKRWLSQGGLASFNMRWDRALAQQTFWP